MHTYSLRLAHCNVNGLCGKVNILRDDLLQHYETDILLITETHLISSVMNSSVQIPGFDIIRNDSGESCKHGVCAFISTGLKYDTVDVSHSNVLSFRLSAVNVFVFVVYRPPSNSHDQNVALIDFLTENCCNKEAILLGDFNLPTLVWFDSGCLARNPSTLDASFLNAFDVLGLTQWVKEPTFPRSGNVLDLILSTESDRIGSVDVCPPPPGCDHCSIHCDYLFDTEIQAQTQSLSNLVWHRGNYGSISERLREIDWDFEFDSLAVDQCYVRLMEILKPLTQQFVPVGTTKGVNSWTPWKTHVPNSLRQRRAKAWETYKADRARYGRKSQVCVSSLAGFLEVNKEYRTFATRSQIEYERSLVGRMKECPKLFHSYIRHKKMYRTTVGPLKLSTAELSDDPAVMAESFATAFASVYTALTPDTPAAHQTCDSLLDRIDVSTDDVLQILLSLDGGSAMGPDALHPALLKACARELAYPLCVIFRLSLEQGTLPQIWKKSLVVPIFKKGSRYEPLNYRPVSLTSVPCKCLEKLIFRHLYGYLTENNLLRDEQFGFRPGRSTEDQLILTYHDVSIWLDRGNLVDLVLFDYSKAFDVVSHSVLLDKLRGIGIGGYLIDWIHHFLTGRSMNVIVKDVTSRNRNVLSGVPQGSVLGPILFLIYINHVASNLCCKYKIFADDLKIYMSIDHGTSYQRDTSAFQRDIDTLCSTSKSWGLYMNSKKCAVLRYMRRSHQGHAPPAYKLDGKEICVVHSHTDLGVLMDDELKFHGHCREVARKAGGLVQNFLKSTVCRSEDFMLQVFTTHVRPILEYASTVWNVGYRQDLKKLESIQRLWTRNILGFEHADYETRLKRLDLFSVKGRLLRADMIKCWKIFHGASTIVPTDLWMVRSSFRTRGHPYKIEHTRSEVDARARFFSSRVIQDWNSLPSSVVTCDSLASFKASLADSLGDRLYDFVP